MDIVDALSAGAQLDFYRIEALEARQKMALLSPRFLPRFRRFSFEPWKENQRTGTREPTTSHEIWSTWTGLG